MRQTLSIIIFLISSLLVHATPVKLMSPNGLIEFHLATDAKGQLVYSVVQGKKVRLHPARAGVTVDGHDLGQGVEIGMPEHWRINETFPWRGNKTQAINSCLAAKIPIHSRATGIKWILEVRMFDDGVGFRYVVPGSGNRQVGGESTAWHLPDSAKVWFQYNTDNYEGIYESAKADEIPLSVTVNNKDRPVFLGAPVTLEYPDGSFGILSEASLFNYSGMTMRPLGGAMLKSAFEDDPDGWINEGPLQSPWRVLVLSPDLDGLVNSDLIPALCDPPDPDLFPDGMNTDWIEYGKAPCTWMVFGNDGAQWEKQKWFVDMAAATGCEFLLVDGGWRTEQWGWLKDGGDLWARLRELCDYAAQRQVGIIVWHAYPDGRRDGPGLLTIEAREELFRNCQQAGVKGVKIDFLNSESKKVIADYEDLLRRAAKYKLTVNFHGSNKPTGELRTWPNEITREGIREQEHVKRGILPLPHYGALPFTRMAVGHADFLPGYFQPRFLKNTTLAFQVGTVIVYSSPFLCWPDNPEAYLNSTLLHFVQTVPVTWDETRVLEGSVIGETIVMARRKGADWYIAALNCRKDKDSVEIDLTQFDLGEQTMMVYSEGTTRESCRIETSLPIPKDKKLIVSLPSGGGFLVKIRVPKEYIGWVD